MLRCMKVTEIEARNCHECHKLKIHDEESVWIEGWGSPSDKHIRREDKRSRVEELLTTAWSASSCHNFLYKKIFSTALGVQLTAIITEYMILLTCDSRRKHAHTRAKYDFCQPKIMPVLKSHF